MKKERMKKKILEISKEKEKFAFKDITKTNDTYGREIMKELIAEEFIIIDGMRQYSLFPKFT